MTEFQPDRKIILDDAVNGVCSERILSHGVATTK